MEKELQVLKKKKLFQAHTVKIFPEIIIRFCYIGEQHTSQEYKFLKISTGCSLSFDMPK